MVVKDRRSRAESPASIVARQRRLLSADEYERMGEAGIFAEDERLELLDGEIYRMSPIGSPHAFTVSVLAEMLTLALGSSAHVRQQNPVRLSERSEPQPDVAVVLRRAGLYRSGHPQPADVLLLIEVAHTSLPLDQQLKLPLYARAGIAEVWIVDLNGERVLVHRGPKGGRYEQVQAFGREATVTPAAFPELQLSVQAILG